ncbi:MAG: MBL fold metallo-hydrolase, partial [Deltaproteobacteria bacterium]|nr:MBL fold metallo-hydrolase [Deltaproteobacteria bacterium]
MRIKFWGTRGSIPVPGRDTIDYGGNTTCLEITLRGGK